jgi:rhomboid family GlyGly-CTERM serine protease
VRTTLARVTQFDARTWRAPLALAAVLTLLALGGTTTVAALRYERAAVLAGQVWRLLTAHLVHFDATHLAWNLLGLAIVAWLFAAEYSTRGWLVILATSTLAIDLGFLLMQPQLGWYVGFSGTLHGAMAAGLFAWVVRTRDWITLFVAAVFAAKLAWEHWAGPLPFTSASLDLPVVHEAHSYGALGGLAAAAWLEWRRRAAARSL